jgi:ABC-type Mn2+/Zn2+ transport system permease subunit
MTPLERSLLLVDAVANFILGGLLLGYPLGVGRLLGLPAADTAFYPSILGAVLVGIGIALLQARAGRPGLGVDGAIAINLAGAGGLAGWLVFSPPVVPLRGTITLWAVAAVVLGIGIIELTQRRRTARRSP